MDSVIFQAMAAELNRVLANSRVDRVIQVTAGTLVLKLWTGCEKLQLLLKADGQGSFYLTRKTHAAPAQPPRFCQLLRARLRRLSSIRAEPMDRIVHLLFHGANHESYDLILEGFGAQGNLILVDAFGRIVDLLWRQEGARVLLPGQPYVLPAQKPRLSLLGERTRLIAALSGAENAQAIGRLDVAPMSPALAKAICNERASGRPLQAIIDQLQESFHAAAFEALRVSWSEGSGLLPLALGTAGFTTLERAVDLSRLLEATVAEEGQEPARDLTTRLAGLITRQRRKLHKRLEKIASERDRQSDPESLRVSGDLILANLHRIRRGSASVVVEDYYQSPVARVTITLDTKLSPQENAERCFKLYRKAKRAGEHHRRRLQETQEELAWLDQVELALDEAAGSDDLYQVQLELESAGLLKTAKGQMGKRRTEAPEDQLHQAETPGGLKIFWGKNSRTNDYVSRRLTAANDLWFHAHDMPGCHLVLKCGTTAGPVPEEEIFYAASLAAGYSRGKASGKVEVIVARGRDVQKPKGARPGLVTVNSYRTVMVVPRRLDE
jgi:predicted ribosome quality control (RQC) complex YloA/Tae2 family protein